MYELLVGGSCLAAGSSAVAMVCRRALQYRSVRLENAASECFSLARYEPMNRLLSQEDLEFLERKAGIQPAVVRRFRAQRRRIFRSYLCELAADFQGLHRRARLLIAEAPEEYAEMVGVLLQVQARFWSALVGVEMRLAMHSLGIGRVEVSGLLAALDELQAMVHSPSGPGLETA